MKFVTPEIEVLKFEQMDVIAVSVTSSEPNPDLPPDLGDVEL